MGRVGDAHGEPGVVADWVAPYALDVRVTLGVQGRGRGDPTYRVDDGGGIWRTSLTPDGPGTMRGPPQPHWVVASDDGSMSTRVRARAWGPGAEWLLGALPGALGAYDDVSG